MLPNKTAARFVLAAAALCPLAAQAAGGQTQTSGAEGFTVTPFVALATTYDDNLFGAAGAGEGDTILSVGPGLDLRYLSPRTEFRFSYSLAAAKYLHHSTLDSWIDEQQGTLGIERKFTDRLSAGVDASYLETHDPERLTPTTGLVYGRTRATEETLRP
ncbi:MAG TPA: hypothetical protein VFX38_04005, partial [Gammaproteobacteria bacterium]|nr:hypothetical protein [Gammaproteobacteria bacterium]